MMSVTSSEGKQSAVKDLAPALFLDRDGVINREVGYLSKPEHVQFLPGIFELCRLARATGHKLIIITNQAGIAREFYSETDFHALMVWMIEQFAKAQVQIDSYYFCPHHPEHGIGKYRRDCADRKPQPGMLLKAAQEHHIDLSRSIFVGDRCSDIQAGVAAGVGKLVLLEGTEAACCGLAARHVIVPTLANVANLLLKESIFV